MLLINEVSDLYSLEISFFLLLTTLKTIKEYKWIEEKSNICRNSSGGYSK